MIGLSGIGITLPLTLDIFCNRIEIQPRQVVLDHFRARSMVENSRTMIFQVRSIGKVALKMALPFARLLLNGHDSAGSDEVARVSMMSLLAGHPARRRFDPRCAGTSSVGSIGGDGSARGASDGRITTGYQ